ncbi:unnamed protein product [Prunus armeniaca]
MSTHPSGGYLTTSTAVGSLKPTVGGTLKFIQSSASFASVSIFLLDKGTPTRTSNPSEAEATVTPTDPDGDA